MVVRVERVQPPTSTIPIEKTKLHGARSRGSVLGGTQWDPSRGTELCTHWDTEP